MKRLIFLLLLLLPLAVAYLLSPSERTGIFILVDNTPPIITILSPQPTSYNNATPLLANFTITDPSLDSIWYSLNDKENISITSYFYLSLPEGDYNLKIYANDSHNRQNFSEVNFTINNSIPFCGDNICSPLESCSLCPVDCGECQSPPPQSDSGGPIPPKDKKISEKEDNKTQPAKENITQNESAEILPKPDVRIENLKTILFLLFLLIILVLIIFYKLVKKLKKKKKRKKKE